MPKPDRKRRNVTSLSDIRDKDDLKKFKRTQKNTIPIKNVVQSPDRASVGRKFKVVQGKSTVKLPDIQGKHYDLRPRPAKSPAQQKPIQGKFNMLMRARTPPPGTKVYVKKSDSSVKKPLKSLKLQTVILSADKFAAVTASAGKTLTRIRSNYKVAEQAPESRTPRGAKKVSNRPLSPLDPVPGNAKSKDVKLTKATVADAKRKNLRAVMKGQSAAEHAESIDPKYAGSRWEWLHLVAHSLGGSDTMDNLVAGTFDRNTEMINVEQHVARNLKHLADDEHMTYRVEAEVLPGSHIASRIRVSAEFPQRLAKYSTSKDYNPLDNMKFTKAQFVLDNYDFYRSSRFAKSPK